MEMLGRDKRSIAAGDLHAIPTGNFPAPAWDSLASRSVATAHGETSPKAFPVASDHVVFILQSRGLTSKPLCWIETLVG